MTVLGWAQHIAHLPCGVQHHRAGEWKILLAEGKPAQTAHDRLALQVKCFDAGTGFLPTAPAKAMTLHTAIAVAQSQALYKLWPQLMDRCQFSLSLRKATRPHAVPDDGRSWLLARKARQDDQNTHARFLTEIAAHFTLPATPLRQTTDATQCDFLVPRAHADRFCGDIRSIVNTMDATDDISLSVTGPWPPFAFAKLAQTAEGAA